MCSATQLGLRVMRLKDEVSEDAARRSETGPGNPYWKRPAGSTGETAGTFGSSRRTGTGADERGPEGKVGADIGAAGNVCADACCGFLVPKNAAAVAAPTAADAPATTASVNFDMPGGESLGM